MEHNSPSAFSPRPSAFLFSALLAAVWMVLSLCSSALAADVQAVVDRDRIASGESLELTVTVKGGDGSVDISPIRDFKVMSNGTSSSVQIVNGQVSRQTDSTYTLFPLKQGRLVIPPLTVTLDNTSLKTSEIAVTVTAAAAAKTGGEDVFARAGISNAAPYEGEPIIYTIRICNAVQIANARFQQPDFTGFTAKELQKNRKNFRTVINGREFNVTEMSFLLIPAGAGAKKIDPAVLQCDLVRRQNVRRNPFGFFDDPFFGQSRLEPRIVQSDPVNVTVKALPPFEGKGTFSGLVGTFRIHAELDKPVLNVGDSATLSVTLSGSGNIMDAAAPEITVPDGFKTYKDTPQEDIQAGENGYTGKKVFRTALVPLKEGQFTLPPVALHFFDGSTGRYETVMTDPVTLTVHPSKEKNKVEIYTAPETAADSEKKQVEFTGRDILPLKEDLDALETRQPLSPVWFWALLLAPALCCTAVTVILRAKRKNPDAAGQMSLRADQAMKEAARADISAEAFLASLSRAIISSVLSKAGLRGEALTYAEAESILKSSGVSDTDAASVIELLQKIDSARFSGRELDPPHRETLLSETRELRRKLMR